MQRSISINIAGISIVFHAPQNWLDAIAERYGKFARREQSAQGHTVDVYLTHVPDIDRVLSWGLNYEPSPGAAFGLPVEGSPSAATIERGEDGTVRPRSAHYDGLWDGKQRADVTCYVGPETLAFEGFLLAILPDILLQHNACILHASGLVVGEFAYLFTGPSGAGKTTVVENSPGRIVLSDEMVVVRFHSNGEAWAYGTPFFGSWGKPGEPTSAPIAWIHFLQKSMDLRLEELSPRECFRRLAGVICYVNSQPKTVRSLLGFAERLIPLCRLLHSYPDPVLWTVVEGEA